MYSSYIYIAIRSYHWIQDGHPICLDQPNILFMFLFVCPVLLLLVYMLQREVNPTFQSDLSLPFGPSFVDFCFSQSWWGLLPPLHVFISYSRNCLDSVCFLLLVFCKAWRIEKKREHLSRQKMSWWWKRTPSSVYSCVSRV